jgi:hypothetical protein
MNILYISKNLDNYKAAMYQKEMLAEISKRASVSVYGPGNNNYNKGTHIHDVVKNLHNKPDWIIIGHAWLSDSVKDENIDPDPGLKLQEVNIPKAIILNKEYVRLDEKLNWIKNNKFQVGFSHSHDVTRYSNQSDTNFIFVPFGFDKNKIPFDNSIEKDVHIAFSGVLQNMNISSDQDDSRVRIMKLIYHTLFDIPLLKRRKFKNMNIVWNSIPRGKVRLLIARLLGKWKRFSDDEYFYLQKRSIFFINTPSPCDIVSPRIFENMACKSIPLCIESSSYKHAINEESIIQFKKDLSDFYLKVDHYINNDKERERIVEANYKIAIKNHSWSSRVDMMLSSLNNCNL